MRRGYGRHAGGLIRPIIRRVWALKWRPPHDARTEGPKASASCKELMMRLRDWISTSLWAMAVCLPVGWATSAAAESGAHRQPPPPPDAVQVEIPVAE